MKYGSAFHSKIGLRAVHLNLQLTLYWSIKAKHDLSLS